MTRYKVWDPLVRLFHWSLAGAFAAIVLFVDDESKTHEWLGYGIAGLIGLRLVWGLIGHRHARFADFPISVSGAIGQLAEMSTGRVRRHLGHTPLGALMIYNLLVTLALVSLTGWMLTTDAFWGIGWVEGAHEVLAGWAEFSVLVHIAGITFESLRTGVNLPKAMITGYKDIPAEPAGRGQER